MKYFYIILPQLISFCILILLGVLMVRVRIVTSGNLSLLSGLIVKLVLPCLIFSLVWENQTTLASLWSYRRIICWQSVTYFFLIALSFLGIRLCRLKPPTSNANHGCMIGGNYGFVVIPLLMALFSKDNGQEYIPICAAVDTFFVWTLGMYLFTTVKGRKTQRENPLKKILNPVICAFLAGLLLCTLQVSLPEPLISVCEQLSNASCLGLVYLGSALCFIDLKHQKNLAPIFLIVLFRQILLPVFLHLLSKPFLPEAERVCIVLITAAPSLSAASMIARQYHLDENYASSAVFITTLASGVTIPLIFYLMAVL